MEIRKKAEKEKVGFDVCKAEYGERKLGQNCHAIEKAKSKRAEEIELT